MMLWGIATGFASALINTVGFLFNARFLLYYKSPVRLLVISSLVMMLISLPLMIWLCPFGMIPDVWLYLGEVVFSSILFLIGQGAFFGALRFFEASRLSSLLGLKIIVLSVIFILSGGMLNWMQWSAVMLAAMAAVMLNWSGSQKSSVKGWLLLLLTLVAYSSVDMVETDLVVKMREFTGFSTLRSSFAVVPLLYTSIGMICTPALYFFKPDKGQLTKAFPYALLWLSSQVLLLCCFAFLQPVFGNVILATRGIFSVLIGMILPCFGLAALDSKIPAAMWMRRIVAALVMLGAIALYSAGSMQ